MLQRVGYVLMGLLWLLSLALLIAGWFPWLCIALYTLHLAEYFLIGRNLGVRRRVGTVKAALLCMLFGAVWWVPLRGRPVKEPLLFLPDDAEEAPAADGPEEPAENDD